MVFQGTKLLRKQRSIVLYVNLLRIKYKILFKKIGQPHTQRPVLAKQIQLQQLIIHHAEFRIGFHSPCVGIPQQCRIDAQGERKLFPAQIAYGRQPDLIQTVRRSVPGSLFPECLLFLYLFRQIPKCFQKRPLFRKI